MFVDEISCSFLLCSLLCDVWEAMDFSPEENIFVELI